MVLNTQNMGKLRSGLMAAAAGLTLVGASYASSEKSPDTNDRVERVVEPTPDQVSVTPAAYTPVIKVTRDSCMALASKAEKIACMKELKAQRRAEIAALDTGLEQDAETIDVQKGDEKIDLEEIDQQRTNIEGLSKVVALQEK